MEIGGSGYETKLGYLWHIKFSEQGLHKEDKGKFFYTHVHTGMIKPSQRNVQRARIYGGSGVSLELRVLTWSGLWHR